MAAITKNGPGYKQVSEQAVATNTSIAINGPGAGFCLQIIGIFAAHRGGASLNSRVNVQAAASTQDPTGFNLDIGSASRIAGNDASFQFVAEPGGGIVGGENQQITVSWSSSGNDTTAAYLMVRYRTVKIRN